MRLQGMTWARRLGCAVWLVTGLAVITLAAETPDRALVQDLVERQARAWETGDEAEFLATLHPDSVFAYPGKRLDRAGALRVFREWTQGFRDTRLRVHRLVIDGAHFCIEYKFSATRKETGFRTASGTVAVGEVRDGLIWVWKEYLDGRVMRLQAQGELPVQEEAEPFPWPDTPQSRRP